MEKKQVHSIKRNIHSKKQISRSAEVYTMRLGVITVIQLVILVTLIGLFALSVHVEAFMAAICYGVLLGSLLLVSVYASGWCTGLLFSICAGEMHPTQQFIFRGRNEFRGNNRFLLVDLVDKDGKERRNLVFKFPSGLDWNSLVEGRSYICWGTDNGIALHEA